MKIQSKNLKLGFVKLHLETVDDLWVTSLVVEPGDFVTAKTYRKVKVESSERSTKVSRKPMTLTLEVEKTDFTSDSLRILGGVREGPEDVPRGSHHTIVLEPNSFCTIKKEDWPKFYLLKLDEASKANPTQILICIMDREDVIFALSERSNYKVLSKFSGDVPKKDNKVVSKGGFYSEIEESLVEYLSRFKIDKIILASPAFWKEDLLKNLKDSTLKKKIVLAGCSAVDNSAITEVLKRPEVKEVLARDRISKEVSYTEALFKGIRKQEKFSYGMKEVGLAASQGAVDILLVSDKLIKHTRENSTYRDLESIMKSVDKNKGKVVIISSEHDGGVRLDGLGGIGALLRYSIQG
jgi:protein pelota